MRSGPVTVMRTRSAVTAAAVYCPRRMDLEWPTKDATRRDKMIKTDAEWRASLTPAAVRGAAPQGDRARVLGRVLERARRGDATPAPAAAPSCSRRTPSSIRGPGGPASPRRWRRRRRRDRGRSQPRHDAHGGALPPLRRAPRPRVRRRTGARRASATASTRCRSVRYRRSAAQLVVRAAFAARRPCRRRSGPRKRSNGVAAPFAPRASSGPSPCRARPGSRAARWYVRRSSQAIACRCPGSSAVARRMSRACALTAIWMRGRASRPGTSPSAGGSGPCPRSG